HGHLSVLVAPIAHTDEDDVPLVTLYTFQVLHKERLKRMRGEETFQFGLLAASLFDLVANGLGLRDAERGDAKREVRALARVLHHGVSDCACLDNVLPASARIIDRFRKVVEDESQFLAGMIGTGKDDESIVVELAIGQGDQRLVAAAVMPTQHALRGALCNEQSQDALQIAAWTELAVVIIGIVAATHDLVEE